MLMGLYTFVKDNFEAIDYGDGCLPVLWPVKILETCSYHSNGIQTNNSCTCSYHMEAVSITQN